MEPLYPGDPERIGPYRVLARLDAPLPEAPAAEERFLARDMAGDRTVLLATPLEGVEPDRFAGEAEAARRLSAPWLAAVDEAAPSGGPAWHAGPYLPAVPLPAALAAHGAPLPERTVLALGTALAETLVTLHQAGITHAGVSPAAVLLAADGPRLTGFGALRAAGPDGQPRAGLPGLTPGAVPPEQLSGARPQPPGDVYALGAVLAYAVTGHTVPERGRLPERLRGLISACTAGNPDNRPQTCQVLDELLYGAAPGGGFGPAPQEVAPHGAAVPHGAAPHEAVPHGATPYEATPHGAVPPGARAAALFGPGWLPPRAVAELARQSAELLAMDPRTD
ncbi:serine/threonine protein kinase [Streptomyces sp. NPDC052396]|uniref:serine/threonine protein kinase n=1 Tax=Streptomyces sp. NPDC052396 TaxID=3365689 RepID=UPI0037CF4E43